MSTSTSRLSILCLATWLTLCVPAAAQAQTNTTVDEQYRLGLYQRETGEPYSAIDTLESLLSAYPTLNRARMELAVAYYRTLNYERARAEAERVLNDPTTPEMVRLSVSSFLKQLELEQAMTLGKPHRFEFSTSLGLIYDSNVNAGPDSALLGTSLSGDLVLDPEFTAKSDWGYIAQLGVQHTWQSPKPLRVGQATGRFSWNNSLSLYQKAYHQFNDQDLGVISLATGPALIVGNGWRGNLNIQFDKITLGSRDLGLYTSVNPSGTWRMGTGGELTADVQWVKRDFTRNLDSGRDSQYQSVGLSYGQLMGDQTWSLQGGLRLFNESARDSRFSNQGEEYFVGARANVVGIDLFARAAWRHSRHLGIEPVYGMSRRETERRTEFGASHNFNEGWLDKWQLTGTFSHVHNKANLSLYGYDRDTVTIALNRNF